MPDLTEYKFEFVAQCSQETADKFFADLITLAEQCGMTLGGGYWEDANEPQSECCRVQKGK